jgi:hypothetical protein
MILAWAKGIWYKISKEQATKKKKPDKWDCIV